MVNHKAAQPKAFNLSDILPDEPIVPVMVPEGQYSQEGPVLTGVQSEQKPENLSIIDGINLASSLRQQGELDKAEAILVQILQQEPNHPQALHILGLVNHAAGNSSKAVELILQAIQVNGNAAFHSNITEIYRQMGQLDQAIYHGEKAVSLAPNMLGALVNLGICYFDKGDLDRAKTIQNTALKINPDYSPSLNNLASILRRQGHAAAAVDVYRKIMRLEPNNVSSANNLAGLLIQLDRANEALVILDRIVALEPDSVEIHTNKGLAHLSLEETGKALISFNQALGCRDDFVHTYVGIARAYKERHKLEEAEEHILRAIDLAPNLADSYVVLGSVRVSMGRSDLALKDFNKALEINPYILSAKLGLGNIYLEQGKLEDATKLFENVLSEDPQNMSAIFSLVQSKKIKKDDALIKVIEYAARDLSKSSDSRAIFINYAMGKINDDLGNYDKGFPYYLEGARLKRKSFEYDADKRAEHSARIAEIFSSSFINKLKGSGHNSEVPIFVVSMPRSGSTLVEQIISSHPDVFGAGELFEMLSIAGHGYKGRRGGRFPENMINLRRDQLKEMGKSYVKSIQEHSPTKVKRITDKMPANFSHIGLIHLILPKAKIVHIHRHPLDTCISCLSRLFAYNQEQTYDLAELGQSYKNYKDLMAHWRSVLPKGSFIDVRYEDLIEDTEQKAKSIIEYCGLEWSDLCLEFYNNKRKIRTASVAQVRKPIYKSSLARWKHYEKYLDPLIEALGDALDDEKM